MPYIRRNYTPFQYTPQSYQPVTQQLPYGQEQEPFDYEKMLRPQPPPPTQAEKPPIDFMKQYEEINRNRPNRLAYQEAVQKGPEVIERGKWAKLAAALAAGGTYLGTGDPVAGAKLGSSVYQAPQEKAKERYRERMVGLGNMAQFEESDVAAKIKALEMQQSDWYKQREDARQQRASTLQETQEERAGKLTELQMKHIVQQMDLEKTDTWTEPKTGITYKRDSKGNVRAVGQTALTPEERAAGLGADEKARRTAAEPFEVADDARQAASSYRNTMAGVEGRKEVATINQQGAAERAAKRLEAQAKTLKPGDKNGQALLEIAAFVRSNPAYADMIVIDSMGLPQAVGNSLIDTDATREAKEQLRTAVEAAYKKAAGGPPSAPSQEMTQQVRSKTDPNKIETVYSYDGGKTWSFERRK